MPTLFGILRDPGGAVVNAGKIVLRPLHAEPHSGSEITITATASGYFTQSLEPGHYVGWLAGAARFAVWLPDDIDYVLLADAWPAQSLVLSAANTRESNAEKQILHATAGTWHSPRVDDQSGDKSVIIAAGGTGAASPDNYRIRGGMLELYCADTTTWHAPYLDDGDLQLAANGATPFENYRLRNGAFQIKDTATGLWRSWYIYGASGEEASAWGPAQF